MAEFTFTEDGSSDEFTLKKLSTHISIQGTFGSGSVALEQKIGDSFVPVFQDSVAIVITAPDDALYGLQRNDIIRLTLTGSTAPSIDVKIAVA